MRGIRVLLAGLAALTAAGASASESPRAERPAYALGEEWVRNDGSYQLVRIEGDRYIFVAGPNREIHLTKDLALARIQRGSYLMEFDPPPALAWPLEVGKWGASAGTWRTPQTPDGVRATFVWRVEAYEDLTVSAGTFKAFRIRLGVQRTLGRMKGVQEVAFRFWYAPGARHFVKAAGEQPGRLDFESVRFVRSGPPPTQEGRGAAAGGRFGLEYADVQEAVDRGEGREALDFYEREGPALEQQGQRVEAARAYTAASTTAYRIGAYQRGIRAGLRALDLLQAEPETAQTLARRASTHSILGHLYRHAGDLGEAERQFREGLALVGRSSVEWTTLYWSGILSRGLASLAYTRGNFRDALRPGEASVRALEESIGRLPPRPRFDGQRRNSRRQLAQSLLWLGNIQRRLGELDAAEASFKRALEITKVVRAPELEDWGVSSLGWVAFSRKDFPRAITLFEEAKALAGRRGLAPRLLHEHAAIGWSHAAQGNHQEALAAFRSSLGLLEDVRGQLQDVGLRSGFLEDKQGIYHGAVHSALALGDPAEAFAFAERSRARAFLDLLGNQATLSKGKTRALMAEETSLRAQLSEAKAAARDLPEEGDMLPGRRQLAAAEQAYRAFLERVRRENLEQASLMAVEPVTLQEVRTLLPGGVSLLEYLVMPSETILWVVDAQRVEVVRIPVARRDLLAQVRAFRQAIERQVPLPEVQARGRALYDQLLAPARRHLTGDRLLIVPHDVLHYLPFGALPAPDTRWVIEDYTLSTLPSASVLKYLGGKGAGAGTQVLAVGNPDIGPALALRFAEREARAVGARYPGATVLVRGAATEPKVKALSGPAGLLHFATHGELNEQDPLSSALLLVPEPPDDGRLEVRKIFGMDLQARLVVLSACETGLGKLSRGDELVGLQRAFLYAGTPAVVTTLWKVDDRASFRLMEHFYAHLDAVGAGAALRAAQQATMAEFPHPFAWAAFGLTGVSR